MPIGRQLSFADLGDYLQFCSDNRGQQGLPQILYLPESGTFYGIN
jgi:hypothetical protein